MRPVNLIPPEDRRGDRAPLRTGAMPYVLIGALVALLAAVSGVVLTGNTIEERRAEVAALEAEEASVAAEAEALSPYSEFATLSQARDATVTSLARSRFDWERVLRELALVIPDDVWLTEAKGTVSPAVTLDGGSAVSGRETVTGPALELIGCGSSHDSVAAFVSALRDIDGVTRVGIASSERPDASTAESTESGPSGDDCRTRDFIARFEIVAAFDAVPAPAVPAAAPAPGTDLAAGTVPAPVSTTSPASGDAAGVAGAYAQQQQATDSAAEQTGKGERAAEVVR